LAVVSSEAQVDLQRVSAQRIAAQIPEVGTVVREAIQLYQNVIV
jgi:hypothetical protein